jgi:hypothetical protein
MMRRLLLASAPLALCLFAQLPPRAQPNPNPPAADVAKTVFELRTYTCNEGKLEDLKKRFRDHTITIFNRHGMESVGYWVPTDGERSKNTLIYILKHPSREVAAIHWREFQADPEWKKVNADSNVNGQIVNHVDSVFMEAADFSAIK